MHPNLRVMTVTCMTYTHKHANTQMENVPPDEEEFFVKPAVQGTEYIIRACIAEGVSRVVLTSSIAAVAFGHKPPNPYQSPPGVSEDTWNQGKCPCLSSRICTLVVCLRTHGRKVNVHVHVHIRVCVPVPVYAHVNVHVHVHAQVRCRVCPHVHFTLTSSH
jgi:hypothetical protein